MAFAVLVVDRHPPVKEVAELGRGEGLPDLNREQSLDLVQKEAPVTVCARDQRLSSFSLDGQWPALQRLGPTDELLERVMVEASQDQDLAAREQRGIDLEARIFR